MKKLSFLLALLLLLSGCSANKKELMQYEPIGLAFEGMLPLNELPKFYPTDEARLDGCMVTDIWNEEFFPDDWVLFEAKLANREAVSARYVMNLWDIPNEDFSRVFDISSDGKVITVIQYLRDDVWGAEYEYERKLRYLEPEERNERGHLTNPLHNNYDHDVIAAKQDGCVIIRCTSASMYPPSFVDIEHGGEQWQEFYEKTQRGEAAKLRIAVIFPETSHLPDGTEQPDSLSVFDIEYDGEYFYHTDYSAMYGMEETQRFQYLLRDEITTHEGVAAYSYYLAGSDIYTEEIFWDYHVIKNSANMNMYLLVPYEYVFCVPAQ